MRRVFRVFNRKTGGYFTIEAAMLFPMILLMIAFVFYLTFYMYDRCVVSQDVYVLAFRGSLHCQKEAEDVQHYMINQSEEIYGNKYIGTESFDNKLKVDDKIITVEANGCMNGTHWKFGAKAEVERICPVECIRKIRLLQKIKNEIITE